LRETPDVPAAGCPRSLTEAAGIAALLAIVYFAAAKVGLSLAFINASASAVWPPTGIALAAVLLLGPRVSLGVFVGAFLANVATAGTLATSLVIAAGNTAEALVGAWLVRRLAGGPQAFESALGVFEFAALAAGVATTISATAGVTVLAAAGFVPASDYGAVWLTWWLGDAVGALIVAPPILLWARRTAAGRWTARRAAEAALAGAAVLVTGAAVFGVLPAPGLRQTSFITIPPVLWIAFRFGARAASTAILGLSAIAVWGTLAGLGPFFTGDFNESLLLLQSFMGVIGMTGLAVGAVVAERASSEEGLRHARDEQEARVRERTASLAEAVRALEEAQQVARIGTFRWELATGRVTWNDELCRIYGIAPGVFDGTFEAFLGRIPPDDREAVRRTISRAVQARSGFAQDERIVRPDGTVRYLHTWGRVILDGEGRLLGMEGVCQDVTERRRADEQFRGLLESAPDAIVGVDSEGRIVLVNTQTERAFGYHREELLGQPVEILLPEGLRAPHVTHRGHYAADPRTRPMGLGLNLSARRKDGSEFPAEISLSPLRSEEGLIVTSIIRDVTERRKAEEGRAQLLAAQAARGEAERAAGTVRRLQAMTDAALVHLSLDDLLRELLSRIKDILGVDTVVLLLLGEEGGELVPRAAQGLGKELERTLRIPLGQGFTGRIASERRPILVEDVEQSDVVIPFLQEKTRSLLGVPLLVEGRVSGVLQVGTLHPHRFTEEETRLLQLVGDRAALAIDHARLYEAERRARAAAEVANRSKDEFLATVSHELRAPLQAILGWARLLGSGKLDAATAARAFETIQRNAKTQAQLIDDILDVSRIVTGKLRLVARPLRLAAVVDGALDALRTMADAKSIRLRTMVDPALGPVMGDPDRLQQVLWNLLSNAIKFTPERGQVTVRVERADGGARITVSDTGKGIRRDFLPHVFERFTQAESSTTRSHGGLGLGLAIVRHLVELHGGRIRAESAGEGLGATFVVELPLIEAAEPADVRPADLAPGSEATLRAGVLDGLRVLVVDDERDTLGVVTATLEEAGACVMAAASVGEALDAFDRQPPDVLVSDIAMPGEDGHALIEKVRARAMERGGRVPAIALTAYAGIEDRTRALLAGYQIHLSKPIDPVQLLEVIANVAGMTGEELSSARAAGLQKATS
jgi:PAS domain S-box-containing protein